jgi:Arc/MetJ-type ribon-helix-helix transcriptional regulator
VSADQPRCEWYADCMSRQIAVRIPDADVEALDQVVASGAYSTRADAARAAIRGLLTNHREAEIAREYARAYARVPDDVSIGEAGAKLASEILAEE